MNSSSDSDDCYSNAALKLAKLKNKYEDDKIESMNLLDDPEELRTKANHKREINKSDICDVLNDVCQDDNELEKLLASTKRITRSSTKKTPILLEHLTTQTLNTRARGRKQNSNSTTVSTNISNKSKGRRGRGGRRSNVGISNDIPIYSVGNTDEYPDQLEDKELFSKQGSSDVVLLDDSDILDDNEEMSVKVHWRSSEYTQFKIRKYQKLAPIFRHFSHKENVTQDKLLLMYNDKILKLDDTPESINYNIAKFIEGGVINQDVTKLVNNKHRNNHSGIQIKFQCQNVKRPFEITVQPNEKLSLAMLKCAEHLEKPLSKLKFEFDGDSLLSNMTPKELELEGGECIDVKITA